MTDEELIAFLRTSTSSAFNKTCADRIEALVKERNIAQHQARMRKRFIEEARDERDRAETRAERLEAALHIIDALDPEKGHIGACSENAIRGLVLRMGEMARAALEGAKP